LEDGFEGRSHNLPTRRVWQMLGVVGVGPEFWVITGLATHDKLLVNKSSTGDIVAVPAIFH
jgi:hypothetical protein